MSDYLNAVLKRRSMYMINSETTLPDEELAEKIRLLVKNLPTAYNMQSTRVVVLFEKQHQKLWDIVLNTLEKQVSAERFPKTQAKIKTFAAGHGTILFFHDEDITKKYQQENPKFADVFEPWVLQHSGMLQLAIWVLLEDEGLGASLQHYNPLIDDEVKETWDLPKQWRLLAQMPFGGVAAPAGEKEFGDIDERVRIF